MSIRDRIKSLRRVRAGDLRPNPRNWRRHPEAQRRAMQAALSEIGYADALLARETPEGLQLIDGHLRAELDPDQRVPVLIIDVDAAEADLDAIRALAADIDFEQPDLELVVAGLLGLDGIDVVEDVSPAPPDEPVTQTGDVWVMGDYRLLCGDTGSEADVDRMLDGATIHLVNTDPPYKLRVEPQSGNAIAAGPCAATGRGRGGAAGPSPIAPGRHTGRLRPPWPRRRRARDKEVT